MEIGRPPGCYEADIEISAIINAKHLNFTEEGLRTA